MTSKVVGLLDSCRDGLALDVKITLLWAGLIFLLALVLGVWKYRQVLASEDHRAHPYVDIAHRAALLYSFATLLVAVFVQLSAWPMWVNLTAAMVLVFFFVVAILTYIFHGWKQDTENQFAHPERSMRVGMIALVIGEVGGFGVLLAGFIAGQF
jgi:NADH:ubiquinone oxidoreductase subunit 5 (subunit L)/multisubunit Na+/H+ antiporter MnhA subunit